MKRVWSKISEIAKLNRELSGIIHGDLAESQGADDIELRSLVIDFLDSPKEAFDNLLQYKLKIKNRE